MGQRENKKEAHTPAGEAAQSMFLKSKHKLGIVWCMSGIQALARLGKGIYPGWPVWAAKQDLYLRKPKKKKKKKIKHILEKK